MILLTPELCERLLANGRRRGLDHVPVVKFFNPLGIGTWLVTELDEDGDTLFGLADLYAQAARTAGRIVIDGRLLRAAAAALQRERQLK